MTISLSFLTTIFLDGLAIVIGWGVIAGAAILLWWMVATGHWIWAGVLFCAYLAVVSLIAGYVGGFVHFVV